jgi:hypothetical protein
MIDISAIVLLQLALSTVAHWPRAVAWCKVPPWGPTHASVVPMFYMPCSPYSLPTSCLHARQPSLKPGTCARRFPCRVRVAYIEHTWIMLGMRRAFSRAMLVLCACMRAPLCCAGGALRMHACPPVLCWRCSAHACVPPCAVLAVLCACMRGPLCCAGGALRVHGPPRHASATPLQHFCSPGAHTLSPLALAMSALHLVVPRLSCPGARACACMPCMRCIEWCPYELLQLSQICMLAMHAAGSSSAIPRDNCAMK